MVIWRVNGCHLYQKKGQNLRLDLLEGKSKKLNQKGSYRKILGR